MGAVFETRDDAPDERLRPLRVPIRSDQVFESVREMVADLDGWEVVTADEALRVLTCRKRAGLLGGTATITIRCEGPEGLPSTVVHVRSTSEGAVVARDRAHVLEFLTPFHRRVC
ncbi:MAG: hypothetical protein NTY35_07790 [Planctomycetota bacterium]|nr:hypothetical protein [Planctomycetota bacterium]